MAKNLIVDGQIIELGGNAIHAYLVMEKNAETNTETLWVKCSKGDIKVSDVFTLGRYITGRKRIIEERRTVRHDKYRGWIVPHGYNFKGLSVVHDELKSNGSWDYWKVTPDGYESFLEYEEYAEEQNDINCTRLNRRCGIAVFREGRQISDWMKFCVKFWENTMEEKNGYALCRW